MGTESSLVSEKGMARSLYSQADISLPEIVNACSSAQPSTASSDQIGPRPDDVSTVNPELQPGTCEKFNNKARGYTQK